MDKNEKKTKQIKRKMIYFNSGSELGNPDMIYNLMEYLNDNSDELKK